MSNLTGQTPVLVGHPFAPIGRGEEIRCAFRAFQTVGLTLPIRDIFALVLAQSQIPITFTLSRSDQDIEKEISGHLVQDLSSSVNIFYINGDEVEPVLNHFSNRLPSGAFNVICPQWELSNYPRKWAKQLDRFDEIWAPSKFVFDSIRNATPKPIFHMPLPVQVRITSFLGRRYFEIPESAYLFLFFFDFRSYIDRKNPFAVIEAFGKVCASRPSENIRLVIKLNHPVNSPQTEADFQRFITEIKQCHYADRVIIIDKVLTDNEIKNLVRCCDCFVSLHRSEGFGRGMAEAMFLGKPAVATGYSGNLDFMNDENSCLVRYDLVAVEEGQYPHAKGQVWAQPDIDHAAYYMLKFLDDRDYGWKLGQIASQHMRTHFSYRAMGLRYKKRLDEILDRDHPSGGSGNMSEDELVPPVEMLFDGTTSQEEFVSIGEGVTRYFLIEHAQLRPDERVLDVGCGIGQKARALTKYLSDKGAYDGIDIVAKGINWCREEYKKYPNFHFQLADIYSSHYNPEGKCRAFEYKFPYQDGEFGVVFLFSVFTHMLPRDMENYLSEISRVLKPGGRCVITFFLLNPEAIRRIDTGLNKIKVPFTYESEACRIADKHSPETTVAHDERLVRSLYEQNGLSITEITYGSWCGRKEFMGNLQDVIIAVKE